MAQDRPRQRGDQYMLRLPEGMRQALKVSAAANGRSLNSEIILRLSGAVVEDKPDASPLKTLRDEFAGQTMAALIIANGGDLSALTRVAAKDAYAAADALMEVRDASRS